MSRVFDSNSKFRARRDTARVEREGEREDQKPKDSKRKLACKFLMKSSREAMHQPSGDNAAAKVLTVAAAEQQRAYKIQ